MSSMLIPGTGIVRGFRRRRRFVRRGRPLTARKRREKKVARVETVKKIISRNMETKWKAGEASGAIGYDTLSAAPYGGALHILNAMAKGSTRNTREGNVIFMRKIIFNIWYIPQSSATRIRYILFIDKSDNTGGTTSVDMRTFFALNPGGAFTASTLMSPLNPQITNGQRYTILLDRLVDAHTDTYNSTLSIYINREYVRRHAINLKNYKVQYNDGNLGTYADITRGALYLFAVSDDIAAGTPPIFGMSYLLEWKDA